MDYIKPTIQFYDTFEALNKSEEAYSYFKNTDKWEDIFSKKRVLLLAEPGYGKTRMLKEVVLAANTHQKEAIYVDLKLANQSIEEYVAALASTAICSADLSIEEDVIKAQSIRSAQFKLSNSPEAVICFDALDEVQIGNTFSNLIINLNRFIEKYDQCVILLSCRTHHFKRHASLFSNAAFSFCKISNFGEEQIKSYLEQAVNDPGVVGKVEKFISRHKFSDILGIPRYLYMFTKLVTAENVDAVLGLNRTDLFEEFIYGKLNRELDSTSYTIDAEIVKRVLEKLALIMEIYQSNTLTKEELLTFFDHIDSNLSKALLEKSNWNILKDKSLIKDNIDHIQFENREFQEYLAAKELMRIAKNEQALYDLVIDPELHTAIPSWFNTLGFFIELDIFKLKYFLDLGLRKVNSVQDAEYHLLLTSVRTDRLSEGERKAIFDFILDYYEREQLWLDHDIAEKVAYYYIEPCMSRLTRTLVEADLDTLPGKIAVVNTIKIIAFLFRFNLTKNRTGLKDHLVALVPKRNGVVNSEVLSALRDYGEFETVHAVLPYYEQDDKHTLEQLIAVISKLKANSEEVLDYSIKGTKRDIIFARYALYQITDADLLVKLLDTLISDSSFLKHFIEQEHIFSDRDGTLLDNIRNTASDSVLDAAQKLIFHVFRGDRDTVIYLNSNYIQGLLQLLKTQRPNLAFDIIAQLKDDSININDTFFGRCFDVIVSEAIMHRFIQEIETLNGGRQFITSWLFNTSSESQFYKIGSELYTNEFTEFQKRREEYRSRWGGSENTKQLDAYTQFKEKLGSEETGYYNDVFEYYLRHADDLTAVLVPEDISTLQKLTFENLNYNPLEATVEITSEKSSGTQSFSITQQIWVFEDCVRVAQKLGWDLRAVQQNIFNFIPFAINYQLETVLSAIVDYEKIDINPVLNAYTHRTDDLARFVPDNLLSLCDKYNLHSALPILEHFVTDTRLEIYTRVRALEVLNKFDPNVDRLQRRFIEWKDSPETRELADKANELLIAANDKSAILWRVERIKEKALKVAPYEYGRARHISKVESELHSKEFAAPLLEVNDEKCIPVFTDILNYAFNLLKEDDQYWKYANYMFEIVCSFYYNLRIHRKYDPVLRLEREIYNKTGEKGANWFKYRIQKLKREYSTYISKPDDILTCILKYNRIMNTVYLFVRSNQDLVNFVNTAIDKELRRFIEQEGYYLEIEKAGGVKIPKEVRDYLKAKNCTRLLELAKGHQEDLIQKTLKVQFENILLTYGLRHTDIIREPQLLDNKRPDFLVSYGFLGPIVIELKTTSNREIRLKKERGLYRAKLEQYANGFNAVHTCFLAFQVSQKYPITKYLPLLKKGYEDNGRMDVLGFNCISCIR